MPRHRSFSVVISTDGRRESLAQTLESLRHLDYPNFEVCVVAGPTPDGTMELLETWRDKIKILSCPVRNISISRNLGIGLAAGEIVAFIDDDAIPESDWLTRLNEAYREDHVVAAGGFAYNPDGISYQWRFGTVDRLGRADATWQGATPEFNFPFSASFPSLLGANSSARRAAVIEIGGFDETYEYYLDETDLCCRLVDRGGHVAQLDGACVHHKFRPSHIRNEARIIRDWYPIIKSKIYYSLVNNRGHHPLSVVFEDALSFIRQFVAQIDGAISAGLVNEAERVRLNEHVERAWRDGLSAGLAGHRRLWSRAEFEKLQKPFLSFKTFEPVGSRRVYCFVSAAAESGRADRWFAEIASVLSKLGHETHIFIAGETTTVDFESGVWVHRIAQLAEAPGIELPDFIRSRVSSLAEAVRQLSARKSIDAVFVPLWGWEAPVLREEGFSIVALADESLRSHADTLPAQGFESQALFNARLLAREAKCILARRPSVANDQEWQSFSIDPDRVIFVPDGMAGWDPSEDSKSMIEDVDAFIRQLQAALEGQEIARPAAVAV